MKTTAFILGILSAFTFTSCKCEIEEEEPKNKYKNSAQSKKGGTGQPGSESDTLQIR